MWQFVRFIQGIGMTPEALETNYITYDLLTYQIWTNVTVSLESFVPDFATRCAYGQLLCFMHFSLELFAVS
jgi:hypothetical protein